ncbi:MAG: hypothetical protein HS115_02240 [Spirochaetales bacterium]|nr:hypothetical protein [Spirochaetales bacterium]
MFRFTDKWSDRKKEATEVPASEKQLDLVGLEPGEIADDLGGGPLFQGQDSAGNTLIFGKFSHKEIHELMQWSGIFKAIESKGYGNFHLELQYLSEYDQRIFVKTGEDILIHIRLKLSNFRFRLHAGIPEKKLLYIDWLLTRNPLVKSFRKDRLFPGQDVPGLGIFSQMADFISNLALGVGARGAFNIPEYFHDALLFHREFSFYDPSRESQFRSLIRDLRRFGAREISRAFAEERIINQDHEIIRWTPGEMISTLEPDLDALLWNRDYFTRIVHEMKRIQFRIVPPGEQHAKKEHP